MEIAEVDSACTAAARALEAGDPLGALELVALRDDAQALALRGVAMAQLGDLARAKELLHAAAKAFSPRESLARARTEVAHAEVALAARELSQSTGLERAMRTLSAAGDRTNLCHARLLWIRRALLLGRVADAERALDALELDGAPPRLRAVAALSRAELALRQARARDAKLAFEMARRAAQAAGIAALVAEVEHASRALTEPAARLVRSGEAHAVTLAEIEGLQRSQELVVDALRRTVRQGARSVPLLRRPVLFELAHALGAAWPADVSRRELIARTFGATRPNESHRARLRVEVGRLRKELAGLARVSATRDGFTLDPLRARRVSVLEPPIDARGAQVVALLADGEAWSTSALALALGRSQRSVQRELAELEAAGRARTLGRARARRWLAPPAVGFTTVLLLPPARSPS